MKKLWLIMHCFLKEAVVMKITSLDFMAAQIQDIQTWDRLQVSPSHHKSNDTSSEVTLLKNEGILFLSSCRYLFMRSHIWCIFQHLTIVHCWKWHFCCSLMNELSIPNPSWNDVKSSIDWDHKQHVIFLTSNILTTFWLWGMKPA